MDGDLTGTCSPGNISRFQRTSPGRSQAPFLRSINKPFFNLYGTIFMHLKLRLVDYNLRGSVVKLEQFPYGNTWLKNSYLSITSHLWNNLPDDGRERPDVRSFTKLISKIELKPGICSN